MINPEGCARFIMWDIMWGDRFITCGAPPLVGANNHSPLYGRESSGLKGRRTIARGETPGGGAMLCYNPLSFFNAFNSLIEMLPRSDLS